MAMEGFGEPKFSKDGIKSFKLKEGSNVYRILPPMHSMASSGKWKRYQRQHFGWCGENKQKPDKPRSRPFVCLEKKDFKTGMILEECEACIEVKNQKNNLDLLLAQLKTSGVTQDQLNLKAGPLRGWVGDHNIDGKYWLLVMNTNNEFGILRIGTKANKELDVAIDKLRAKGINPISANQGVWFDFVRTKTGPLPQNVEDKCFVVEEYKTIDGRTFSIEKMAPLNESQLTQALQECPDLNKMFTALTHEQISMLVNSSGDPKTVDEIFAMAQVVKETSASKSSSFVPNKPVVQDPLPEWVNKPTPEPPKTPVEQVKVVAPPVTPPVVTAPVLDQATIMAQIASLQALLLAQSTATAVKPATTTTSVSTVTNHVDEFDEILNNNR
jgi:hypothetical protein